MERFKTWKKAGIRIRNRIGFIIRCSTLVDFRYQRNRFRVAVVRRGAEVKSHVSVS